MPYKPVEVGRMLTSKLRMRVEETDHQWFVLEFEGLPPIRTKVSHNKKDIGDELENRIVKQLRIRKKFFHELMDCSKNIDDYERQVREDPCPPFDIRLV